MPSFLVIILILKLNFFFSNLIYFLRLSKPFLTSKLEFIRHISNACNQVEEPVVKVLTEQKKKRTPAVLVVPTLTSQRIQV